MKRSNVTDEGDFQLKWGHLPVKGRFEKKFASAYEQTKFHGSQRHLGPFCEIKINS